MNSDATIEGMMNTTVLDVTLRDVAHHMEMDRVFAELEPLTSLTNLNIRQHARERVVFISRLRT
jgi:hypothetical protein